MYTTQTIGKRIGATAFGIMMLVSSTGCTAGVDDDSATPGSATVAQVDGGSGDFASIQLTSGGVALFDSSVVHDIEIEFDRDAYDAMIATYENTGEKEWIEAIVTIDGTTLDQVGHPPQGQLVAVRLDR